MKTYEEAVAALAEGEEVYKVILSAPSLDGVEGYTSAVDEQQAKERIVYQAMLDMLTAGTATARVLVVPSARADAAAKE